MSMEKAFQNEVSIKLAEMEQRLIMSQAASLKIMREDVGRLQTKLHAEMESKMESKNGVCDAPMSPKVSPTPKAGVKSRSLKVHPTPSVCYGFRNSGYARGLQQSRRWENDLRM